MNRDPDYSAAYVELACDDSSLHGSSFVFTIGTGNDVQVAAIRALEPYVVGRELEPLRARMGEFAQGLTGMSHWRWLGPEKGIVHMAMGAVINAVWDLHARQASLPLWELLAGMSPLELSELVDYRYLTDVLTPVEAVSLLEAAAEGRGERRDHLLTHGYPAYTTTPGWLGYSDEKLTHLCREAGASGFAMVKLKVGASLKDDLRRLAIAKDALDGTAPIAVDANQRWDVGVAIDWIRSLAMFEPLWVEEPTSPDDILGHAAIARAVAPIRVATGEHVHNRVMFKQFLQARALDVLQLDATRVGGVNENVAILLLAAKFGVPVCPHAGGVGLCEVVQHLAMFDLVAVSGSLEGRMIEHVDHLHEHFVVPVSIQRGHYCAPRAPGTGAELVAASVERHVFPSGEVWETGALGAP